MKRIGEWIYALAVCHKYSLSWNPFCALGGGAYQWKGCVCVNPFSNNFISIFMHEVGHHVHDKKVKYSSWVMANGDELRYSENGHEMFKTLEAESLASRYAVLTGKCDKGYLERCFNTYTGIVFKAMHKGFVRENFSQVVDASYKGFRRIRG